MRLLGSSLRKRSKTGPEMALKVLVLALDVAVPALGLVVDFGIVDHAAEIEADGPGRIPPVAAGEDLAVSEAGGETGRVHGIVVIPRDIAQG
jgi:hypothetical protein